MISRLVFRTVVSYPRRQQTSQTTGCVWAQRRAKTSHLLLLFSSSCEQRTGHHLQGMKNALRTGSSTSTVPQLSTTLSAATQQWISLNTTAQELSLDFSLPTGQSFRWKPAASGQYIGVVGERAVSAPWSLPISVRY